MIPLALVLSLLPVAQAARAQDPAASKPARLDVIVLENGERFEGRVLTELDGYVEFELEQGSVVGVGRAQVKEIRRGAGAAVAAVAAVIAPSDEWFALHDARGKSVGWLHATVVVAGDGTVTVTEEYEFLDGNRRYQVTSQCTAGADLAPLGCYFRERISEPMLAIAAGQQDRIVGERIVDARCEGDRLVVIRADGQGRRERSYEWSAGATFPLLARVAARVTGAAIEGVSMFDPATEEIAARSVAGHRRRAVTIGGENRQVTEIIESGGHTSNSVWVDAGLRTVRREISGPALVAVPSSARSAKAQVGRATIPAAKAPEAAGAFALWVPNPAWRAEEILDPGQIALVCAAHGASIALTRVDHLEPGTETVMAAEAVANWFRLLHPELRLTGREHVTIHDRRAVRLIAESPRANGRVRATVDVIPHDGQFLVLICRAPEAAWRELAGDFAFVQRTIELEPQSVEPPLQGPLLDEELRQQRGKARVPKSPNKARELPTVRIPANG